MPCRSSGGRSAWRAVTDGREPRTPAATARRTRSSCDACTADSRTTTGRPCVPLALGFSRPGSGAGCRCVEEMTHHVEDQFGPGQAVEVCGAREHRQLGGGDAGEVTVDVAPAQLQE